MGNWSTGGGDDHERYGSYLDPSCLFARVLSQKRRTYELQTEHGIINRKYSYKDILPVPTALANSITVGDNKKKISVKTAALANSRAKAVRVVCKCKEFPCSKRCGCMNKGKKCSIYCHGPHAECGNEASGTAFGQYAIAERPCRTGSKGGDRKNEERGDSPVTGLSIQ